MEIKEIQNKSNEIVELIDKKLNVNPDISSTFIHLIEEIGEIANHINKPNIRNEEINKAELSEEFADVFILLMRLSSLYDIDIEKEIIAKIEKNKGIMYKLNHNNL